MRFSSILVATSLSGVLALPAAGTDGAEIISALKEAEVIPDVLDTFVPLFEIKATYLGEDASGPVTMASLDSEGSVKMGSKITPAAASAQPVISISALNQSALADTVFTIAMTDPDAISRKQPLYREFLHWLATDVKLSTDASITTLILPEGLQLAASEKAYASPKQKDLHEYFGPGPPPKTGYHRYTLALLRPIGGVAPKQALVSPASRPFWGAEKAPYGVRDWAKANGLEVVGATYFNSESDKQ